MPVLTGIYIKAENNQMTFSATDLELGITCVQPVQVIEEGHAVIPAHFFAEIVIFLVVIVIDTVEMCKNDLKSVSTRDYSCR